MKLGVVADIHGNLPALKIVWHELQETHEVDAVLCVGDIVGVLGWPEETAHFIKQNADYTVFGNHDAYVREDFAYVPEHPVQKQEHAVVTSALTEDTVDWLNNLPATLTIDETVHVGHAHPFEEPHHGFPADNYVDKRDWTAFGSEWLDGDIAVMGHTHDAGVLDVGKFENQSGLIVNPGSVGQPWDKDARYAVIDTDEPSATLHRAYYETGEVRQRFEQLGISENPSQSSFTF